MQELQELSTSSRDLESISCWKVSALPSFTAMKHINILTLKTVTSISRKLDKKSEKRKFPKNFLLWSLQLLEEEEPLKDVLKLLKTSQSPKWLQLNLKIFGQLKMTLSIAKLFMWSPLIPKTAWNLLIPTKNMTEMTFILILESIDAILKQNSFLKYQLFSTVSTGNQDSQNILKIKISTTLPMKEN